MRIGYKHKETGVIISLEKLKDLKRQNAINIQLAKRLAPYEWEKEVRVSYFTFVVDEVLFSDEFELVYEKESDLTYDELCFLEHIAVRSDEFFANKELASVILDKFSKSKRNYHELRYTEWV